MQIKSELAMNNAADADIEFVLSECVRFHQLLSAMTPAEFLQRLSSADSSAHLTISNGRQIVCGVKALQRLHDLATRTLRRSDASGTVEPDRVYRSLKQMVALRFIEQQFPADIPEVERMLTAAVDEAKQSRSDAVHFIPCRLIHAKEPSTFNVGPVLFYARDAFEKRVETLYADYIRRADSEPQRQTCEALVSNAKHYYDGFSWVGEVKILQCDSAMSIERANLAVHAALNVLHVLLGADHTGRMAVGGPRLADDPRAHLHLDADGLLDVSGSRSATSEVGFGDGLSKFFGRADVASLVKAAAKAIEPLVDPNILRPLGLRVIDAFAWFGDAAREQSDGARIIKATNGLERLLATSERKGIGVTKAFCRRGVAICYDGGSGETFDDLAGQFKAAYEIRSDLAHGFMSPFDPEVKERAPSFMILARRALCCALGLFEQCQLFDQPQSDAELAPWLDRLAEQIEAEVSHEPS
jgi:Apea-like HEPN